MVRAVSYRIIRQNKKALSLVIGKEPLLIADYFDWVDFLKISR